MGRSFIILASTGLFLAVQSVPVAAQAAPSPYGPLHISDSDDHGRAETFKERRAAEAARGVVRPSKSAYGALHISDSDDYGRAETFKERRAAEAASGVRLSTSGPSPFGPLHVSEDDE